MQDTKQSANEWLTVDEAAAKLKISPRLIYSLVARGEVRSVRIGNRNQIRFREQWIDQALENKATQEPAAPPVKRPRHPSPHVEPAGPPLEAL